MATFQKDGLWIQGGEGALANVSEDTPFVPGQVGRVMSSRKADGKVPKFYQYVQRYTTEANTAAAGLVAYWQDLDDFVVTADVTDALGGTTNPVVAGVFLGASPAAGKYGFIQVGGIAEVAVTDTVAVGDAVVAEVGTFNQLESVVALTTEQAAANLQFPRIGIALEAVETSTNSAVDIHLSVLRNGW